MYTIDELNQVEVPKGCLSYKQITESLEEKLKSFTQEENIWTKLNMSKKGDVACGAICSPKIGLGIHWTYSYSRSVKFALTIVAFGKATNMIFTTDDVKMHNIKKGSEHTVEDLNQAIEEIFAEIADGVAKTKLTEFRKNLVAKTISFKQAYHHAADLYFDTKFLSPTQLSAYQSILEPLKESEVITMWGNFTCMNVALADGNPKTWLKDNRELSILFKNEFTKTPLVEASEELEVAAVKYLKAVEETETNKDSEKIVSGITPVDLSGPTKIISPDQVKEAKEKVLTINTESTEKEIAEVLDESFKENLITGKSHVKLESIKENLKDFTAEEKFEKELEEAPIAKIETIKEEPAPIKKGLGLFSKLTEKVVSENTGKTKNIIVAPTMTQEQIENVIEERDIKFNKSQQKNLFVSDELTDDNAIEEITIAETEDNSLIDDFDIPEADDFENIELEETEAIQTETNISVETDDDFGADDDFGSDDFESEIAADTSETDYDLSLYGKGKQPDNKTISGSVTAFEFNDQNLTVVIQN